MFSFFDSGKLAALGAPRFILFFGLSLAGVFFAVFSVLTYALEGAAVSVPALSVTSAAFGAVMATELWRRTRRAK